MEVEREKELDTVGGVKSIAEVKENVYGAIGDQRTQNMEEQKKIDDATTLIKDELVDQDQFEHIPLPASKTRHVSGTSPVTQITFSKPLSTQGVPERVDKMAQMAAEMAETVMKMTDVVSKVGIEDTDDGEEPDNVHNFKKMENSSKDAEEKVSDKVVNMAKMAAEMAWTNGRMSEMMDKIKEMDRLEDEEKHKEGKIGVNDSTVQKREMRKTHSLPETRHNIEHFLKTNVVGDDDVVEIDNEDESGMDVTLKESPDDEEMDENEEEPQVEKSPIENDLPNNEELAASIAELAKVLDKARAERIEELKGGDKISVPSRDDFGRQVGRTPEAKDNGEGPKSEILIAHENKNGSEMIVDEGQPMLGRNNEDMNRKYIEEVDVMLDPNISENSSPSAWSMTKKWEESETEQSIKQKAPLEMVMPNPVEMESVKSADSTEHLAPEEGVAAAAAATAASAVAAAWAAGAVGAVGVEAVAGALGRERRRLVSLPSEASPSSDPRRPSSSSSLSRKLSLTMPPPSETGNLVMTYIILLVLLVSLWILYSGLV